MRIAPSFMQTFKETQAFVSGPLHDLWDKRHYWLRALILAALGLGAAHLLEANNVLLHWRYLLYQEQTSHPLTINPAGVDTVFVVIDDEDFWKGDLARRLPLKRDYLAALVTAINNTHPRAVALDLDMREPNPSDTKDSSGKPIKDYEQEDKTLTTALQEVAAQRPLILPRSVELDREHRYQEQPDIYDGSPLSQGIHNVFRGYIQLGYDLRTIPSCIRAGTDQLASKTGTRHLDSLAFAMLQATYPETYAALAKPDKEGCKPAEEIDLQFGHFMTADEFKKRRYTAARVLKPDQEITDIFSQSVVIVCGGWHQRGYGTGPVVDEHDTPSGIVAGAFVHANYYEALIHGRYLGSFSAIITDVIELLAILISAGLMLKTSRVVIKISLAFMPVVVMIIVSYVLMQNLGAFFECFIPVIVLLCHIVIEKVLEWRDLAHQLEGRNAVMELD